MASNRADEQQRPLRLKRALELRPCALIKARKLRTQIQTREIVRVRYKARVPQQSQISSHEHDARHVDPLVHDEVVAQGDDGEQMGDGGEEGELGDDLEVVDGEFAVFHEGDELHREAGHDLRVGEREQVFGQDARPEGGRAPVGARFVVDVGMLGSGEAAAEEGDDFVVAVKEGDGEGDEEGETSGCEEADDDLVAESVHGFCISPVAPQLPTQKESHSHLSQQCPDSPPPPDSSAHNQPYTPYT